MALRFEKLNYVVFFFIITALASFSISELSDNALSIRDIDRDRDGIVDELDVCPQLAETYNKFEDDDGCPDTVTEEKTSFEFPDTDGDGIEDRKDKCIYHPENFNGYLDRDGCPEIIPDKIDQTQDSDFDSIPDSIDVCPTEKETFNEFQDGDGCPDTFDSSSTLKNINFENQCYGGKIPVIRINTQNPICVTIDTAKAWEKLGIGEIISLEIPEEEITPEEKPEIIPEVKPPFTLPKYPNQPEVNPNLIAGYDYSHPPQVHKVTEGVWVAVGYDLANSIMIEGDDGLIIVDTLSNYEVAKKVMGEFRKISDKPVKAIIYTHGHLDHVHGTGAFLEEGENIEIYAHENHVNFYIDENSVLGPIASQRSAFASGSYLPEEGPDRLSMGVLAEMNSGTIAYALPTQTFSDELEVEISGVNIKMVFVGGESPDQIYVWLPEKETLLSGDNIYAVVPNIHTLRGSVYRDPMEYVNALDKMIPLNAEYLVPSHVKPVIGEDKIRDILVSTRDATQYIYDQTIRGMNQGYTADELAHMIKLPENLENHPWLTKTRNQISSHVKAIYYGNLGWFEGDAAFITPISVKEKSQKIVEGFGGEDSTISEIRKAIELGEYEWAAELSTYAINADPQNEEAKLLKAHSLRVLGQRSDSMDIRHWSLTEALVLEDKISLTPDAFTQTSAEQMAELPVEKLLEALPTKLDPVKAEGANVVLGLKYLDLDKDFTLHVRNNILAVTEGYPEDPDLSLSLDSDTHKLIIGGHMTLLEAIQNQKAKFVGNVNELIDFIDMFDDLTIQNQSLG